MYQTATFFGTGEFPYFNNSSQSDQYMDWPYGFAFPCSSRLPESGTPVPRQHVKFDSHVSVHYDIIYKNDQQDATV